jgi:hypothetical protein
MNADSEGVIAVFHTANPKVRYPWKRLQVNECFLAHIDNRNRVDVQAHYHSRRLKRRFTSVKLRDNPTMFAVFRTK